MRRRASFIGAAMPERIECIGDRFLLIASQRKGEILSGRSKDQNIGYCPRISHGGPHRLGGQLGLQLEAALEAARATEAKRQNEVPRSVAYGGPDESQPKPTPRSFAAAPPIAQPVLVGFPMSYWAVARLEPRREQLALRCLGLAGNETYFPRLHEHRISHGHTIEIQPPLFPGYC